MFAGCPGGGASEASARQLWGSLGKLEAGHRFGSHHFTFSEGCLLLMCRFSVGAVSVSDRFNV